MENFTDMIFSLIITVTVILLPYTIIYMVKGKLPVKTAKIVTVIISIYSLVAFILLHLFTDGKAPNFFPIILWNIIGNRIISPSKHQKNQNEEQSEEQSLDTSEDVMQIEMSKDSSVLEEETDWSVTVDDEAETSYMQINNEEKKIKTLRVLSVFLFVCVIALSVITVSGYIHLSNKTSEIQESFDALKHRKELLVEENNELNDNIEKLNNKIQSQNEKISFYEEYAVCVDEQSNYYHTYGKCNYFDDSSFWIFNIEAAKDYGYKPCPVCFE